MTWSIVAHDPNSDAFAVAVATKAFAVGADAVMVGSPFARATEAPGRGYHWGSEAHHGEVPRGARMDLGTIGSLEQILRSPRSLTRAYSACASRGSAFSIGARRSSTPISLALAPASNTF